MLNLDAINSLERVLWARVLWARVEGERVVRRERPW